MKERLFKNYHSYYKDGNTADLKKREAYLDDDYGKLLPSDKNAVIIDVGCGMGHFLWYLQNKGYHNIKGIDICDEQLEWCKNNVCKNVEKVDDLLTFFLHSGAAFDLIIMNDLIEHLPKGEMVDILTGARKSLKPGGTLVCRLPNMSNIFGIYLLYNDFTHETGFTENSLRQLLHLSGFNDVVISGNKTRINCLWKKPLFYLFSLISNKFITLALKYIYMPGSKQPRIMNTFLIAAAREQETCIYEKNTLYPSFSR